MRWLTAAGIVCEVTADFCTPLLLGVLLITLAWASNPDVVYLGRLGL